MSNGNYSIEPFDSEEFLRGIKGAIKKARKNMEEQETTIKYVEPETTVDSTEDEFDDYTSNEHTEDVSFVELDRKSVV